MKMSWQTAATLVLALVLLASCGASTSNLLREEEDVASNPSTVPWDNLEDPHTRADPAELFHAFWEHTDGGRRQLVLLPGRALVACGYGKDASLDAMAECKRGMTCFGHTIALFYSDGISPKEDEPLDERKACAQCICFTQGDGNHGE